MPRRDASYMEEQRRMIARAARRCMLEKGWAATSTRDICKYAGISKGALYVHFKTREEIFAAVAELEEWRQGDPVDNWADYEARVASLIDIAAETDINRKLMAASYEFFGEFIRSGVVLPEMDRECDVAYTFYRESLRAIHERGEISLPLGLDPTMRLHIQIQSGAIYCMLVDRRQDCAQVHQEVVQSLRHTAGLNQAAAANAAERTYTTKRPTIDPEDRGAAVFAPTFPHRKIVEPIPSNDVGGGPTGEGSKPDREGETRRTRLRR